MNNFYPEQFLEIAKQKAHREILASTSARKTGRVSFSKRLLSVLGNWMVAGGEKLQILNAESLPINQLEFSQNKAGKART